MCCFFLSFSYELAVGFEKIPTQCTVEIRCVCVCSLIEKKEENNMSKTKKKSIVITTRDERGRDCFFLLLFHMSGH